MAQTPGRRFYEEQVDYLVAKDVDGLIDHHYSEDAVLVAFDFTVCGRDALKQHFRDYLEKLGSLTVLSTDKFTETDDTIFFEATVKFDVGTVRDYDAFVLQNNRICYHFTSVIG